MRRVTPVAAALVLIAAPLAAQTLHGSAALGGGWVRTVSLLGSSEDALRGVVIGGEGRVRVGRFMIDAAYREGGLSTYDRSETRDYAEGHFLVMASVVRGVEIAIGPHARAFITNTGTQRWLFWSLRLRGERDLITPSIAGYVELWRSLSAKVNVSEAFDKANGGEVGMKVRFSGSRFWSRVGYQIERAWLGARRETVEGLNIVVGYGAASVP
jgi:hypothetical protein